MSSFTGAESRGLDDIGEDDADDEGRRRGEPTDRGGTGIDSSYHLSFLVTSGVDGGSESRRLTEARGRLGLNRRGHSATPTAAIGRARSARRVGTASARTASTVDPPRIARSGLAWHERAVAAGECVAQGQRARLPRSVDPTPRPIATINAASQRAIERTWRGVAPVRRSRASSRPRRSAIIANVLTTAIDVKAKMIATNSGVSQRLVARSASSALASSVARSPTRSPG